MSTKRTEESLKFIQIKGQSPPEPYPCGISPEVSQDTAFSLNSQPYFALFLSPLAELLGRYSLPELPNLLQTWTWISISPHSSEVWASFCRSTRNSDCLGSAISSVWIPFSYYPEVQKLNLSGQTVWVRFCNKLVQLDACRLRPISELLTTISLKDPHPSTHFKRQ